MEEENLEFPDIAEESRERVPVKVNEVNKPSANS